MQVPIQAVFAKVGNLIVTVDYLTADNERLRELCVAHGIDPNATEVAAAAIAEAAATGNGDATPAIPAA